MAKWNWIKIGTIVGSVILLIAIPLVLYLYWLSPSIDIKALLKVILIFPSLYGIISFIIFFLVLKFWFNKGAAFERKAYKLLECERKLIGKKTLLEDIDILVTPSDNKFSIARTQIKKILTLRKNIKDIFCPSCDDTEIEKKIMEFLNSKAIPQYSIFSEDFRNDLRHYLNYSMICLQEKPNQKLLEINQNAYENSRWGKILVELDSPPLWKKLLIVPHETERQSILWMVIYPVSLRMYVTIPFKNIFMPDAINTLEQLKKIIMELVYGLYKEKIGILYINQEDPNTYISALTQDIKIFNRKGYLLLTDEKSFDKFKLIGLNAKEKLNYYWGKENFETILPGQTDISPLEYSENVFIYFVKKKEAFQRPEKSLRLKKEPKFRKRYYT